jgi:hypothetical protein
VPHYDRSKRFLKRCKNHTGLLIDAVQLEKNPVTREIQASGVKSRLRRRWNDRASYRARAAQVVTAPGRRGQDARGGGEASSGPVHRVCEQCFFSVERAFLQLTLPNL